MATRPVHMVRATACGRGRRGDSFTADWRSVRCADCEMRRPAALAHCLHCHRPITGECLHLARFAAWLHAECGPLFERTPLGRHLLATEPQLYNPLKCRRCGQPGPDHGPNCRGAR